MKINQIIKQSALEIVRNKRVSLFLILNFSLGLLGFFLLQVFQESLSVQTQVKAKMTLGGDISISARRLFTGPEVSQWEKDIPFKRKTQVYSLFSMLNVQGKSKLVNVQVIDSFYPLYGKFKFEGLPFEDKSGLIWIDSELQKNLNLKISDEVKIGAKNFKIAGFILDDPTRFIRTAGFAFKVFIKKADLTDSELIQPGSTLSETWNYELTNQTHQSVLDVKKKLEVRITDPVVQIESAFDSQQDSNRILKNFVDYLGLVSLVSLGLCFLCGSYLLQWMFGTKKKNIAIYKTLGLSDSKIILIYFFQVLILSIISTGLSILLVKSILPFAQHILFKKFQLDLPLSVSFNSLIIMSAVSLTGPVMVSIPQILQIFQLQPIQLFQLRTPKFKKTVLYFVWFIISLSSFWFLSFWQSHSYFLATIFIFSLVILIFSFQIMNYFFLLFIEKISSKFGWVVQYSLKGLARKSKSTYLIFSTMSLATLVLSLLPHLKNSILYEIKPESIKQIPKLFLFDIQPEQVEKLQGIAQSSLAQKLQLSPMVRSRILKVNNQNYERFAQTEAFQTRESENEARFRNRGVNLTYSENLSDSEYLTSGNFSGVYDEKYSEIPLISLEEKYADRINVKIGDVMTFDVQGLQLKAKVASLRKVRWTSFRPNFFILFPKNVLEEAPQIFLTSVFLTSEGAISNFQKQVVESFPNISIIDVAKTVESSMVYIDQMAIGLQGMAWMAVLVGFFVFIILINTQMRERISEMNLLQIIGGSSENLKTIVLVQFSLLISISIFTGVIFGLIVSKIIVTYFFDLQTIYDWPYLFVLLIGLIPFILAAVWLGMRPLTLLKPVDLIRQM